MQLDNLKTKFLGRNNIHYKEIDSTQSEIWRLIEQNTEAEYALQNSKLQNCNLQNKKIPNGTLVFADIQTKGKGTHGRIWHTDEPNNIAFSFFIQMNCNIKKIEGITVEIANIIVDIFKEQYGINLGIKKPNDIVINNKKIGGILTETKLIVEKVKYLVVGIGINTQKEKFSDDIKDIATSIKKEFNIEVNTESFITEFCYRFEKTIIKRIGN